MRFTTPAAVLLLLGLLVASRAAHARVIEVGPARAVRTINAAVARAAVGDEIVLDRGVEFLTSGLKIEKDAIEIRSAAGAGAPATIRNVSTAKWVNTIEHRGEGLLLKDLILSGGPNVTCIRARGRRLTVDNAVPADSVWRWVHLDGAAETTVRNCDVPKLSSYAICAFDRDSRALVVERCTFAGGDKESHTIRLQRTYGALIRDCTINGDGARSVLNIRDGGDNRIENCTIEGSLSLGPLADGDGGINLPSSTPAEIARRETELRRTQKNLTFKNCTIDTDGITVEMGVQNLVFETCVIRTIRPWALRLNRDEYEPWRNIPTGRLLRCELIGPPGLRPFERDRPEFYVVGTVINGVRVPDTAPASTQPASGGGSVPAGLPTTQRSPQGSARREEVLAALNHVETALAELHVARMRLHSSTQPAGDAGRQ